VRTPLDTASRPGLPALRYRVGTHGDFLETMKARLATTTVEGVGSDGQTLQAFRPLAGLTTRDPADPSIALLDGWAVIADVLGFYQERIANEGYLRTATERRSILELARLTGYALQPGVAASVYLAYTLEDKSAPVEIPEGSRAQSIPAPGETAQSFETSEALTAHVEWNDLGVRRTRPQDIDFDGVLALEQLTVEGTSSGLIAGDKLLFEFSDDVYAMRTVASTTLDFEKQRTTILLQPVPGIRLAYIGLLSEFIQTIATTVDVSAGTPGGLFYDKARAILRENMLGLFTTPQDWTDRMERASSEGGIDELDDAIEDFNAKITNAKAPSSDDGQEQLASPSKLVTALLKPTVQQARSGAHLQRDLLTAFAAGADTAPQLLVKFEPRLAQTYYGAWAKANVNAASPALVDVHALRTTATLFGSSVPKVATYDASGKLNPQSSWPDWPLDTEEVNLAHLDQLYDSIAAGSLVVLQSGSGFFRTRDVYTVTGSDGGPRTAYGISGKSTTLTLDRAWWGGIHDSMGTLRSAIVYAQTETLTLAEVTIDDDVSGQEIELGRLHSELTSGRWMILKGERTDIDGVTGVTASELLMVSGLRHGFDADLAGDTTHTTLLLATSMAYTYKRDTVVLYGNVVKATHGETRLETLGSGDATQSLQTFVLKQPPLTYVSAPTVSGIESTLVVRVDDVEWHEKTTLSGAGPSDRIFITKTDDDASTSVVFGSGTTGARLPTGTENARAQYRSGIGLPGNVTAGQISLLQTKPLGVKAVINPLAASGGADKESLDQARGNAPLAVMALDRLVSLRDYADFARTFAGIGKAVVTKLTVNRREVVHLTVAGAEDAAIDTTSDLYLNLLAALRKYGAPELAVQVDARELVALVLSARIRINSDHEWETVEAKVRAALLLAFGFARRGLGQAVLRSEVISVIQAVRGVEYVDLDVLGGIPDRITVTDAETGVTERRLRTPDEITAMVTEMLDPAAAAQSLAGMPCGGGVSAAKASVSANVVAPAQLAIFSAAVPDTLILNPIV